MTNIDSILKSITLHYFTLHYIALPANVCLVIFFSSMFFSSSHVCQGVLDYKKKLGIKELMLLNCGVGGDS